MNAEGRIRAGKGKTLLLKSEFSLWCTNSIIFFRQVVLISLVIYVSVANFEFTRG